MADQRSEVLTRIREALADVKSAPGTTSPPEFGEFLPTSKGRGPELESLFSENSAALKTEVCWCATPGEAREKIQTMAREGDWKRLASHGNGLCRELLDEWGGETVWIEEQPDLEGLAACQAGVTTCEALLAEPGSVLVSARNCGGRTLSVLPPHHVVLARRDQLQPNLAAAMDQLKSRCGNNLPAYLSVISGPSRTADIERVLVLGAHGPRQLTVIVW